MKKLKIKKIKTNYSLLIIKSTALFISDAISATLCRISRSSLNDSWCIWLTVTIFLDFGVDNRERFLLCEPSGTNGGGDVFDEGPASGLSGGWLRVELVEGRLCWISGPCKYQYNV